VSSSIYRRPRHGSVKNCESESASDRLTIMRLGQGFEISNREAEKQEDCLCAAKTLVLYLSVSCKSPRLATIVQRHLELLLLGAKVQRRFPFRYLADWQESSMTHCPTNIATIGGISELRLRA